MKPFVEAQIGVLVETMKDKTKHLRIPVPDPTPPAPTPPVVSGFPRIWSYQGNHSNGTPLMTSPGVFDQSIITALGKRHLVTFASGPWTNTGQPSNQNVIPLVRAASIHPDQKILVYELWQFFTQALITTSLAGQQWLQVLGPPDRRVFFDALNGGGYYAFNNPISGLYIDYGNGGTGHPVIGVTMANLWKQFAQGKADGYFFDVFGGNVFANVNPAGYGTVAALNAANDAECKAFVNAMLGTGLCYFNRGFFSNVLDDTTSFKMTGELYEGWDPGQGGGNALPPIINNSTQSFDQIMTTALSRPWTAAGTALIKSENDGGFPGANAWERNSRFGLASSCILSGMHTMWKGNQDATAALWWADEYSVALPGGVTDFTAAHMGWLGQPIEAAHFTGTTGCWTRRFQNGIVAVNGDQTNTHTINLGAQYRRITGTQFPSVNDGSIEQNATIQGKDGRFYVNL